MDTIGNEPYVVGLTSALLFVIAAVMLYMSTRKCAGDNLHWLTKALMTQIQPPKTSLMHVYHASGVSPELKFWFGFIFDISCMFDLL